MQDLLVNLASSVLAGVAVWTGQRMLRYHRRARMRAFFGIRPQAVCLLLLARHFSSRNPLSVHRQDVAAAVEVASIINDCGGRADLSLADTDPHRVGQLAEFCVGGPSANPRTAAHLRALLPGVSFGTGPGPGQIEVGGQTYHRDRGVADYALIARVAGPAGGRPVFLIVGQTALANLAAARLLARDHRQLARRYGTDRDFCLVLRVVEPDSYGPDYTEIVADVSAAARRPVLPPAPAPPAGPAGTGPAAIDPATNPTDPAATGPVDPASGPAEPPPERTDPPD
ncbi:hypothetical protein [Plantactinospora sp. GCM10030261]|uniref:hypothetical protein n=1 Tax=Plantactinospora sp. GCM10030261 TaxID=3273420 RepID=UPI003606DCDD